MNLMYFANDEVFRDSFLKLVEDKKKKPIEELTEANDSDNIIESSYQENKS